MTFEELHDSMKEKYNINGLVLWMGLNVPSAIVKDVNETTSKDGRRMWIVNFLEGHRELGVELLPYAS